MISSRRNHLAAITASLVFAMAVLLTSFPPLHAQLDQDFDDYFKQENTNRWIIAPAGNGGMTKMGKGYDGYDDLGHGGFDIYFNPPRPRFEDPTWVNRLFWRFSADYFPLQVPEGIYGVTEDLYSVNNAFGFKMFRFTRPEEKQFVPFIATGFGFYWDRIELDTPASGKKVGMHNYFGVNGSAGIFFPSVFNLRLVPEVRWHGMRTPGNFWVTHYTLQCGLALWLVPARTQ